MEAAKISQQDSGKKLPSGWRWVRLREVISEAQGGFASGERDLNGIIQLRMNNVTNRGTFDWSSFLRVPADSAAIAAYRLEVGDVLFNNTNSTDLVGKTALFEGYREPVVFSNHFTRLRAITDLLSPDFLSLWLQTQWQQRVFATICNRWIGQSAVQRDKLLAVEIPLPPLSEQKRIAAILNEQMAGVERARAAAEAQLAAAKALPATYLRTIFNSPDAQKWPKKSIQELGDPQKADIVQTGPFGAQLHSSEFTNRGVPVLNIGNVQWGYLDLLSVDHVTESKADTLERYKLSEGDLLFTRSGTVGRCAVVPDQAKGWLMSYHLLRVTFNRQLANPDFVVAAIRGCADVQDQVRLASKRGSTRDGVNTSFLSALRLPTPSLSEQERLAARFGEQVAIAEQACVALEDQLATINKLPAALLRRAFSGEI